MGHWFFVLGIGGSVLSVNLLSTKCTKRALHQSARLSAQSAIAIFVSLKDVSLRLSVLPEDELGLSANLKHDLIGNGGCFAPSVLLWG